MSLISIDREHGLVYLHLCVRGQKVLRTLQPGGDVLLDLNAAGEIVGIELLNRPSEWIEQLSNELRRPDQEDLK